MLSVYIPKGLSDCPIQYIYHLVYLKYLSLLFSAYHFSLHLHVLGGELKVLSRAKPNLACSLVFAMYPRVYYLTTHTEVLNHNATPVPRIIYLRTS